MKARHRGEDDGAERQARAESELRLPGGVERGAKSMRALDLRVTNYTKMER